MVTTKEMLQCAARELAMRHRAYPGFVERGKMSQIQADREIMLMQSIVTHLQEALRHEETGQRLF